MKKNKKIILIVLFILSVIIIIFVLFKNKNYVTSNFTDFQLPNGDQDKTAIENSINTGQYKDRSYYDLFNDLYFRFHKKDSTGIFKCIDNKETSECTFYNAVLYNNEKICNEFPIEKYVASPGKYGISNFKYYYRSSCILNTRMLEKYNSELDKVSFCKTLNEGYIINECLIYTCESYYWNKEKPEICTKENINSWFDIR